MGGSILILQLHYLDGQNRPYVTQFLLGDFQKLFTSYPQAVENFDQHIYTKGTPGYETW